MGLMIHESNLVNLGRAWHTVVLKNSTQLFHEVNLNVYIVHKEIH